MMLPHHDGSALHVSHAHPELGDTVNVRVRVPDTFGAIAVHARSNPHHEPRWSAARLVGSQAGWDWWEAAIEIETPEHNYRFLLDTGSDAWWLSATGLHHTEPLDSDDFLIVTHPAPPEWARRQVMYEIFPDRFARSRHADDRPLPDWAVPSAWGDPVVERGPHTPLQYYGGDLDGITERLDHLERIGATLLYLTPFFAGASNHRYNASSFDRVDPLLGGDEALIRLVDAAHARGIRVIGDLTANHCGDEHEWFQRALASPDAPEREFFHWRDDGTYESWLGVETLPKLNWNSRELRRRFIEGPDSVVAHWLKPPFRLDGWRIDVANMTGRLGSLDLNEDVRRTIRATMIDINPDTILLAESTNDTSGDFRGDAWHGAMTYTPFTRPVWGWLADREPRSGFSFGHPTGRIPLYTATEVRTAQERFVSDMPWHVRAATMNALDTHDTARFATHASDGVIPVAVGLSMTLPGIPVVFAGDELGLTGIDGEDSRTPMPWDTLEDHAARIDLYSRLARLRTSNSALRDGGMRWIATTDDALVFVRETATASVLVFASRAPARVQFDPNAVSGLDQARVLFGDALVSDDGVITSSTASFTAFALPGVTVPGA